MNILEKRIDALCAVATAESPAQREKALLELKKIMHGRMSQPTDPDSIIRDVFLELGSPDHLIGYEYAIEAIKTVVEDRDAINHITFGIYPTMAVKFNTTASRVERAIRHLIETTWNRGDMDVLVHYFGNTVNPERGKPTNGEFIARMANVVKQKMRNAA